MSDFTQADRISDRIVGIINDEIKRRGTAMPLQILAGQLLGLKAYLRTMPREAASPALLMLDEVVCGTLDEVKAVIEMISVTKGAAQCPN